MTVPHTSYFCYSAPAWNGVKGGIVVVRAKGKITIISSGMVTAAELGFRGSPQYQSGQDYACGFAGEVRRFG